MAKVVFVGVDGGGSHCRLMLQNEHGDTLGEGVGGPSNIRLSVSGSWASIQHAFQTACREAQLNPLSDVKFHACMGLAGTEDQHSAREFLATPHCFQTLYLESDAHTACFGAHDGRDGAIIIVGTGVIGYHISNETCTKVGGWGFPHSDEGGGAWLGLEISRALLHMLDGRRSQSPLLKKLLSRFDNDTTAFVHWVNRAYASEFATLAPLVIEYVKRDDPVALELLKQSAKYVSAIARALRERTAQTEDPCALLGGIAPFITAYIDCELRERLVTPKYDAVIGALQLVKSRVCNTAAK